MAKETKEIKDKGMAAVVASIEKSLGGKGIIRRYGEVAQDTSKSLSYGYEDVDEASNRGGVKRGSVIEIFGPESGGKSFLTLKLIASAQKEKEECALFDAEQSFDPIWAAKHGVDVKNLFVINEPMFAEQYLDYVAACCTSGAFGLVVVDSTAALLPQKEGEGSVGDADYALLARAMSKALRKIIAGCGKTGTICVFVNQIREKMNVLFGSNETTPGGRALKFYSSVRIRVAPGKVIKMKGEKDKYGVVREKVIARQSYVKFVKNKTAPPFGECMIEIVFFEDAMSPVVKLCNLAKDNKLIGMREGQWQIKKVVTGEKSNIDTQAATLVHLADYLVKNDLTQKLIDAYLNAVKAEDGKIDSVVQSMVDNPKLIVSPLEGKDISQKSAVVSEDVEKTMKKIDKEDKEDKEDTDGSFIEEA